MNPEKYFIFGSEIVSHKFKEYDILNRLVLKRNFLKIFFFTASRTKLRIYSLKRVNTIIKPRNINRFKNKLLMIFLFCEVYF